MTVEAVVVLAIDEILFGSIVADQSSLSFEIERPIPTSGDPKPCGPHTRR